MLSIKNTPAEEIAKVCDARGLNVDVPHLREVYNERKRLQQELESIRAGSNIISESIKSASQAERETLIKKGAGLKHESKSLEEALIRVSDDFNQLSLSLPNDMAPDTPIGTEESNIQLEVFGTPRHFDFKARDHLEIGRDFGMDLEGGTRIAGSGFPLLKGPLAQLEGAILRYVYDKAIRSGFTPVSVPLLAKTSILKGIGFNPRRQDKGTEIFFTLDDLCLSGTAEIPLVGQFAGQIINTNELPIKLVAMTPCFRREGASGRRDAGLYRNRMFNKCELVVLTTEDKADQLLEQIRAFETEVFKSFDIHFRVLRIASGDLGAPAYKKYDLEGWMMGRGEHGEAGWGELTSASNCTDFQARRLQIKHKSGSNKAQFVYTLNGTGVTTRALICLLEQHQNLDGSVTIPPALRPYMDGREVLKKD
jgi:seryl-tRNA synthetase